MGFLWKYGGLYLDHDVLVLKPLLEESVNNQFLKSKPKNNNQGLNYNFPSDNYIGFQSLNISHLLPKDPTPGENQDLYIEESSQNHFQGNLMIIISLIFQYDIIYLRYHMYSCSYNNIKHFIGLGGDGIGTSVMRFKNPRHPFISKWMYR